MSFAPKQLVAHDFADLPALLAQAGRTDLLPAEPAKPAELPAATEDAPALEPAAAASLEHAGAAPGSARLSGPDHSDAGHTGETNLSTLLAELERANASLVTLLAQDEQERRSALEGLERYDAALTAVEQARHARDRAGDVLAQAQQMVDSAFSPATQAAAREILETARAAGARAGLLVAEHERRVEALSVCPEVQRALQERERLETAQRRADALATARTAIAAGWLDEARAALLPLAQGCPNDAEVVGLLDQIASEQLAVRGSVAQAALWTARRELRRDPEAAASRLAALDLEGLPRELVGHVFGTWLRACARLCRVRGDERPVRYAPAHGRGAVLVRESPAGGYVVLSALGMDRGWRAGRRVRECVAQSAQPLLP